MPDAATAQRTVARPEKPPYEGLFREPVYADGGPYDSDTEEDPEGPGIITP